MTLESSLIMESTPVDPEELPPGPPPPPPPPGEDSDSPGNDDMEGIPEPLQEVHFQTVLTSIQRFFENCK